MRMRWMVVFVMVGVRDVALRSFGGGDCGQVGC